MAPPRSSPFPRSIPSTRQSLRGHQGHGRAHPGGPRQGPRPALRHPPLFQRRGGRSGRGRSERLHDPETHLIPSILLAALGKRPALGVFGTDFPTPDGTAVRDYVHVADLASAHLSSPSVTFSAGGASEAVNLGTSRGYSVLEVVRAAEEVVGGKVPVELLPRREGDVPVLLASREKARRLLGWEPGLSDIGTILRTAWDWHRKTD